MASRHLMKITNRLLEAGRRSDEPMAIISKATTPAQSVLVSTLGEIARARVDVQAPAIVVIGKVVGLRAALDWVGSLDQQALGKPS
jgi:uroporphyrin-III C-methyltransferase